LKEAIEPIAAPAAQRAVTERQNWRRFALPAIVVAVCVLAVGPFFYSYDATHGGLQPQIQGTHDLANHLKVMEEFDRSLKSGVIEPRWFSKINHGYGSATLNFYPRLFYYLTSLINLAFSSPVPTLFVVSLLSLIGSIASFYWLSRMFYGRVASVSAAIVYGLLPYHQLDLYWRGALPEYAGFAILPLILLFAIKVAKTPSLIFYAALGLVYGIHLMLHMPVGLMFSYAMVFFALFWSVRERNARIAVRIGLGMAIGVVLSATYWLPAMLESKLIFEYTTITFPYHSTYISPNVTTASFDGLITRTFKYNALIVLGTGVVLYYRRKSIGASEDILKSGRMWLVMGGVALFMCTSLSYDVSVLLPKIEVAVPPFRWLAVSSLFSGLLVALSIQHFRDGTARVWPSMAVAIVVALNLWLSIGEATLKQVKVGGVPFPTDIVDAGFTPAGATSPVNLADTPNVELQPQSGMSEIVIWDPESRLIRIKVDEPTVVRLKTYNFAGWRASIDGEPADLLSDSDGVQIVNVPAGMHMVATRFTNTWPRTTGQIVSVIGLLGVVLLFTVGTKRERTTRRVASERALAKDTGIALTRRQKVYAAAGILIIAVGVLVLTIRKPHTVPATPAPGTSGPSTPVDSDASLFIPGVPTVSIATDQETMNQLVEALSGQDGAHIEELHNAGKLLRVENRTRIRVLERAPGKVRVRISEGQYQWAEGWVPDAWVR
jgi:4-amino-4-deoxy-L-arabinose transferase-like glycosyltransferase